MTEPTKVEHKLLVLEVVRDSGGIAKGVKATCTCGWSSELHFTSFTAQSELLGHFDEVKGNEADRG